MSTDYSEHSEQEGSNFPNSEGENSGHSASGQSVSLSLKSSDIFGAFRFQDIFALLKKFWYIIFFGVLFFTSAFFFLNLNPPPFKADTVLRIRSVKGKNKVKESVSIKGEADDLRSPDLIRTVVRSLNRPTVVVPVNSIMEELSYFLEKRTESGLIAAMQPDKYNFDLQVFEVPDEEGTFYVSPTGNGTYILYDSEMDEVLQGRFGVLIEDLDVTIQVDSIHGEEGQLYELKYLSEDEMVAWAVEGIQTWRDGKDGAGGAITLSFFTYDKVLLTRFLNALGKEHVLNTERRLQKGTVKALKEKKDKLMFIEQDLFKLERELEKLQRANAATGNLATSANELRQQAMMAEKKRQDFEMERTAAEEKYKDLRTVFASEHPLVQSARVDLRRVQIKLEELNRSTEGVPELMMKIQNIEESLQSSYKEKQLLDEEIGNIEAIRKGSTSYISVSQEAQIRGNTFTAKPPRMATLGALSGLVSSIILIVVANLRVVKTLTLDGDYSAFSDGRSVDNEMEGSTKSSSQFLSSNDAEVNSKIDYEDYSSQDADLLFQDYSSEADSASMYISEGSSPSELDAPNVHSIEMSVAEIDSTSLKSTEMSFLEENFIPEHTSLVATGVWSSKTFSEKGLKALKNIENPILEVVNNTETSILKALIIHARFYARSNPTIVIDMQTDESSCGSFHQVESRSGFWDILSKKASLKECILQTSHRYFILPAGAYSSNEVQIGRVGRLLAAVQKKFAKIIILHSQDTVIWRSIRTQMKNPGILLWLQADYSLYRLGAVRTSTTEHTSLGDVLYKLWGQGSKIRLMVSGVRSQEILKNFITYQGKGKVLLIEACNDGFTLFPSISKSLRLESLLSGVCSPKDAIHEVSSSLYVIPGSPFSEPEKYKKLQSIIRQLSQKFSRILIIQDKKTPQQKDEIHVVLGVDGSIQVLDAESS